MPGGKVHKIFDVGVVVASSAHTVGYTDIYHRNIFSPFLSYALDHCNGKASDYDDIIGFRFTVLLEDGIYNDIVQRIVAYTCILKMLKADFDLVTPLSQPPEPWDCCVGNCRSICPTMV